MIGQQYTISSTDWRIETATGVDTYAVINCITNEQHIAYSYKSAAFLQRLFNDQSYWYNYERNGTTITLGSNSTGISYAFSSPPQANWRYSFGDSTNTYFQFYLKKAPNAFQRWAYYKILGVKWEKVI